MNEWSDASIAAGIALMLQVFLGMLAFLLVAAIVKFFVERVDAKRPPRSIHRGEFRRVERHSRARQQMAREIRPRFPEVSALDQEALERRANHR